MAGITTQITPIDAANISPGTGGSVALGKEINVASRAVTGGTLYITSIRGVADSDPTGVSTVFAATTSASPNQLNTSISTVGAGTITAASVGGLTVTRAGVQTGAFTDTMDTAANLASTFSGFGVNSAAKFVIRNTTAYNETIVGTTNVTASGDLVLPPQSEGVFLLTMTAAGASPTWTVVGLGTHSLFYMINDVYNTAALTVGTLSAGQASGAATVVLANTGATPGNQTMRTPAQILADTPGMGVGMSWQLVVTNAGTSALTLLTDSGSGFTMTGNMAVGANTASTFIVTIVTATTGTVQFIENSPLSALLSAQYNTNSAASAGNIAANTFAGAAFNVLSFTGAAPGAQTLRTVAQILTDSGGQVIIGHTFITRVMNSAAATNNVVITTATGWTLTGDMNVEPGTFNDYAINIATGTTATATFVGSGQLEPVAGSQYTTLATGVTTGALAISNVYGAPLVTINSAATTPGAQTLPSVASMITAGAVVGEAWFLAVIQTGTGTLTLTADGGAQWTVEGTATVATNKMALFHMVITGATAGFATEIATGLTSI